VPPRRMRPASLTWKDSTSSPRRCRGLGLWLAGGGGRRYRPGCDAMRLGSAVRGQAPGLRPTPPYREFGRPAGRVPGSGRQRAIQTTPGSMSSKPLKNRSMSCTGRT